MHSKKCYTLLFYFWLLNTACFKEICLKSKLQRILLGYAALLKTPPKACCRRKSRGCLRGHNFAFTIWFTTNAPITLNWREHLVTVDIEKHY